jgi:hypothetical protein
MFRRGKLLLPKIGATSRNDTTVAVRAARWAI